MKFRHGLAVVLLSWMMVPAAALAAAAEWRMVNTPHFRVLSQVGDRETAKWIRNYEQFISATADATGIKPTALPPLTMILFANDKGFTPYKMMRPDGKAAKVAGQFITLGGASTIGLAVDSDQAETRRTIYHEATHWLMSVDPDPQPTWFSEGIAEMLSTFEPAGSKVSWAKPIDAHLLQLQDTGMLPMMQFLTRVDALQDQDRQDDRFYAQSWAFVHFLMLSGDRSRTDLLTRFLTAYKARPGEESVREVFGPTLATLERDFNRYVHQPSFSYFTFAAAAVPDPPASIAAPPGIVEGALGFMALGVGRKELALQHAKRATELAPDLPGGHEVLTYLASDNRDFTAAQQHAEAAVRTGSRDSQMYLLLADSLARDSKGNYQETQAARVRLFQKAIELDPARRDIYQQLAGALMFQEKPQGQDLLPLEQGQRRFPDDDWIKVGVATTKSRLSGSNDALPSIQQALRPESKLTPEQRKALASVKRNLLMQAMDAELRTAQQQNNPDAGRNIIARYRELVGDDPEVTSYMKRRDGQFEMAQLMSRVQTAMANGRTAELNPLFEQILAHPAVTPELRNMIESTRSRMK